LSAQEDKDFGYWGIDFQAYSSRAKELGMFLDRRPVQHTFRPLCLHSKSASECCSVKILPCV